MTTLTNPLKSVFGGKMSPYALVDRFPHIQQGAMMDCGPTCLAMIFKHYGVSETRHLLTRMAEITQEGTSLYALLEIAENYGFKAEGYELDYEYLQRINLPCIAHYEGQHFVVVYEATDTHVRVADPAFGKTRYTREEFCNKWSGIVLELKPTEQFYQNAELQELVQEQKKEKLSVFRQLYLPIIKENKRVLIEVLLFSLVLELVGLVLPLFTQTMLDDVLVNQNKKLLMGLLVGLGLVFVVQVVLTYTRSMLMVHYRFRFEMDFMSKFFERLISLKQKYYDNRKREEFMARFQEGIGIRQLTNPVIIQNFLDVAFMLIYFPLLFSFSGALGAIALACFLAYCVTTTYFIPIIKNLRSKVYHKNQASLGGFLDALLGIKTVKLLSLETYKLVKWKHVHRESINSVMHDEQKQILINSLQRLIFIFSQIAVFWMGAYEVFTGTLSIGQYMAFTSIFMTLMNAVNSVSMLWMMVTQLSVSFEKVNEIFLEEREEANYQHQVNGFSGNVIRFENVSFRYNQRDERYVLRNVNCEIRKGERIGIVGRNGAGKSTFVKLLVNLYPEYEGKIYCDGVELREINPKVLRKHVYMFPQDTYIFNDTIKENIRCANLSATTEEVIEAAALADLHTFVKSTHVGYNQMVGSFGSNLSGGQVLKIGFARLFVTNPQPDVLILDEASSALDVETEKKILENIDRRYEGKTTISIAHRLHTLRNVDRILVFDEGTIVEEGSHKDLVAKGGIYYDFMKTYVDY
ncbi:ATP-binding cassette, subfamily B, bacterial [Fibrisoma limi BUZ 3]|uniref:ATP-binding cassette, subfamily B, bacterial n=1 Tax=Fibrisoma limi BUZ 3 TaxID=1185876 RepID=I2GB81_9BACT|nr:peptidase domain-containing ABC transporter [Fibrisoma limi]CCH51155.1 ATP-binding cassette, subfamily B, bacterial [Fibrisoma limi BUZ 3]